MQKWRGEANKLSVPANPTGSRICAALGSIKLDMDRARAVFAYLNTCSEGNLEMTPNVLMAISVLFTPIVLVKKQKR